MAKKQTQKRATRPGRRPAKKAAAKKAPKLLKNKKVSKTKRVTKRAPHKARAAKPKTRKVAGRAATVAKKKRAARTAKATGRKPARKAAPRKAAALLERPRRRLPEAETDDFVKTGDVRQLNTARFGLDEFRAELKMHTESSPVLTAGDVDANWQDAYAQGDESPGGDNPTPDQDRVDDIGKALGIVYDDDEELMGGEEITERDEHRWELNPASREEDEDEDG